MKRECPWLCSCLTDHASSVPFAAFFIFSPDLSIARLQSKDLFSVCSSASRGDGSEPAGHIWQWLETFWEKAMATHSCTLAWKIPWTEGPGGLQSMGSLGVRHDWVTSFYFFTFMHWRRKWQHTPVFWVVLKWWVHVLLLASSGWSQGCCYTFCSAQEKP